MYTTESLIREVAATAFAHKGQAALVGSEEFEKWVASNVKTARDTRVLLTAQQYADFAARRGFVVGDRARYVGVTRAELTDKGATVVRSPGQVGTVTAVNSGVVTFQPDADPVATILVRLLTSSPLVDLERIPTP